MTVGPVITNIAPTRIAIGQERPDQKVSGDRAERPDQREPNGHQTPDTLTGGAQLGEVERQPAFQNDDADRDADCRFEQRPELLLRMQDAGYRTEKVSDRQQHHDRRHSREPGDPLASDSGGSHQHDQQKEVMFHAVGRTPG